MTKQIDELLNDAEKAAKSGQLWQYHESITAVIDGIDREHDNEIAVLKGRITKLTNRLKKVEHDNK